MLAKEILLHLSLIDEIGDSTIQKIVDRVSVNNLSDLYFFTQQDFERCGFDTQKAQRLVIGLQDRVMLENELVEIGRYRADYVTIACDAYPKLLKQIHVPPAVLYYQGDAALFAHQKLFACVGARKAHRYVYDSLVSIVQPMIQDDWVVVSGGALGADTYAHNLALDNGKKTIVVIGSGLAKCYPPQNRSLFNRVIEQGGLIVSPFPMKTEPEARCFPVRNRIISGLSVGCLVLQAAQKSGALITAHYALEQGREVFAVPGSVFDPLSIGCHNLIKQGAKLTATTQDILEELGGFVTQENLVKQNQMSFISKKQDIADGSIEGLLLHYTVSPCSVQDLLSKTGLGLLELNEKLLMLSFEGKIEQDMMGFWKRA